MGAQMTNRRVKWRKRFGEGADVLCSEIEETLLLGQGVLGVAIELRCRDDWERYWARYREIIMPKALEAFPGCRPFAMYVVGEIPARPVVQPPPLVNGFFKLYVPGRNGVGQWHYCYPEPFMQAEPSYLYDLGVIDKAELKRYRASLRKPRCAVAASKRNSIGDYILEAGLYE
jgi:hypothetical protein